MDHQPIGSCGRIIYSMGYVMIFITLDALISVEKEEKFDVYIFFPRLT